MNIQPYLKFKESYTTKAYKEYKRWILPFIVFGNGTYDEQTVYRYIEILKHKYRRTSIPYAVTIIKNFLRYQQDSGEIPPINLFHIRVPRARTQSHLAIPESIHAQLIQSLPLNEPMYLQRSLIIRLLHDTGVRVNELCNVRMCILEHCKCIVETEKTVSSRAVFWTEETERVLERYLLLRREIKRQDDYLFCGLAHERSNHMTARQVERIVREICTDNGIAEKYTPHGYRHAFIQRLAKAGVPDSIIAIMVGHSTPNTIQTYTKMYVTDLHAVHKRVFFDKSNDIMS